MGETKIEWTRRQRPDGTFAPGYSANFWWGCVEASPECDNCYAREWAKRCGFDVWGKDKPRRVIGPALDRNLRSWNAQAKAAGEQHLVFVQSMSDVMELRADLDQPRRRLFDAVEECENLAFLMLTKHPQNFRRLLPPAWLQNPRQNVWLMTTVGVNASKWRRDILVDTPAVIRGLSMEPLLEYIDVEPLLPGIHWAIVGGESGPKSRPMNIDWALDILRKAGDAGVARLMKQFGARPTSGDGSALYQISDAKGGLMQDWPEAYRVREFPI